MEGFGAPWEEHVRMCVCGLCYSEMFTAPSCSYVTPWNTHQCPGTECFCMLVLGPHVYPSTSVWQHLLLTMAVLAKSGILSVFTVGISGSSFKMERLTLQPQNTEFSGSYHGTGFCFWFCCFVFCFFVTWKLAQYWNCTWWAETAVCPKGVKSRFSWEGRKRVYAWVGQKTQ